MKIIRTILSNSWLSLLAACVVAGILIAIRIYRGLDHLDEQRMWDFFAFVLVVFFAAIYQLIIRRGRVACRTLLYGFFFALLVVNMVSMMVDFNIYRTTWRNSTATLPDGLGKITISHRSLYGDHWVTFPAPPGSEQMWKTTLHTPDHAPRSFMIRDYIVEPDEIKMSLIQIDNKRILRLRGIGPYGDNSAYLDMEKVSLTKEVKGKERELGVWKWDEDGKLGFRQNSTK